MSYGHNKQGMDLQDQQVKPSWQDHEAELLRRGYQPYWDDETQSRIGQAGIACCSCGKTPSYVGMTDCTTALGFLACDPDCGQWIWFLAPAPSTRP